MIDAAGMFATSLALISQEFHGKDRATAFGVWGAVVGGAVAIGPLVGGVVTEALGWEWIFFINIPIGIAAMVLTEKRIVNVFAKESEPVDLPGLVTFSAALFLLIFGLIRGNPEGWGSPLILTCLVGAAVPLLAFVAIEHRSRFPMLDLTLFRRPAFNGVSAVAFRALGGDVRDVPLRDHLPAGFARLLAAGGRRALPALSMLGFLVAPISGALSHKARRRRWPGRRRPGRSTAPRRCRRAG